MRDLDEEDRDILSMRFYSGLKFREIARIRNEPLGTALWKGRRALERLKGILAEQGSTDEM
jgi:DNA-directed RNA polymerase specialized sigma24 family protein